MPPPSTAAATAASTAYGDEDGDDGEEEESGGSESVNDNDGVGASLAALDLDSSSIVRGRGGLVERTSASLAAAATRSPSLSAAAIDGGDEEEEEEASFSSAAVESRARTTASATSAATAAAAAAAAAAVASSSASYRGRDEGPPPLPNPSWEDIFEPRPPAVPAPLPRGAPPPSKGHASAVLGGGGGGRLGGGGGRGVSSLTSPAAAPSLSASAASLDDGTEDEEEGDASNGGGGGSERHRSVGRRARGAKASSPSSSRGPSFSAFRSSPSAGRSSRGGFARRPTSEVRRELARLEQLTAAELLEALESGAPLRKKWLVPEENVAGKSKGSGGRAKKPPSAALAAVASVSAALAGGDAAAASRAALAAFPAHLSPYALPSAAARRPVRHVSVSLEEARLESGGGGSAASSSSSAAANAPLASSSSPSPFSSALVVRYYHARSGKRLLSRARARAAEARVVAVLAPGGTSGWRPGASLLCLTSGGGVLALEAADAAAHAAWALGLNAGLALARVRRRGALLDSRARSVPRSPVFLVVGEEE